ncbi:MAG: CDP-diacylglycerol--serine O-phosphatidyltransferase [Gemmataceae bacterium]|nr:CDP-diacylglycerol--serine O-phosphatidyltransferase [Gemmataceae bacterium]
MKLNRLRTLGAGNVKKIAIIPTLLTLGNAVCGFAAIAYASKIGLKDTPPELDSQYFYLAGWLIVAAMVFDSLDGYAARLSRTASKFGMELDSLCDAISFGVAPAFILLRMGPGWDRPLLHQTLAVIASLYMVCAIMRLARYNVESQADATSTRRFKGLPSPAAAGCIAALAVLRGGLPDSLSHYDTGLVPVVEVWATLGALAVGLLMVSQVPYPHMTKQLLRGKRHFNHLIQLVLAGFVIFMLRELALIVIFWGYVLAGVVQVVLQQARRTKAIPAPTLEETEPR